MVSSRRKFIKISALGLGGLAATSTAYKLFASNPILDAAIKENIAKNFVRSATYCEVCFWKCAAWVHTDTHGDIKKIIIHLKERGIGILITDHNVRETLDVCEHAYIVSHGEIIAEGDADQILANQKVRDVYLGEQFTL